MSKTARWRLEQQRAVRWPLARSNEYIGLRLEEHERYANMPQRAEEKEIRPLHIPRPLSRRRLPVAPTRSDSRHYFLHRTELTRLVNYSGGSSRMEEPQGLRKIASLLPACEKALPSSTDRP